VIARVAGRGQHRGRDRGAPVAGAHRELPERFERARVDLVAPGKLDRSAQFRDRSRDVSGRGETSPAAARATPSL